MDYNQEKNTQDRQIHPRPRGNSECNMKSEQIEFPNNNF